MSDIKIGIPLHGKMSARALHAKSFRDSLSAGGFDPIYFLSPHYYRSFDFDSEKYFELQAPAYDQFIGERRFLQTLKTLRRFVVRTETTDLRFRELIEGMLFDAPVRDIAWNAIYIDILRRVPNLGNALLWLETFFSTHVHDDLLKKQEIKCVLIPGMGNYGFWNEGFFALEAQRLDLPVFAAITNYDNIVNMGFRGFTPDCLAVWSRQMADETMKLHDFPASKIEITGPVQYDRFFQLLPMDRETFLRSLGFDPNRKTIVYAGGVNITRYFEIYRLFVEQRERVWSEPFNFIMRPYPHIKLLSSPGWQILEKLFREAGAFISDPGSIDAGGDRTEEFRRDLAFKDGPDELSYLLRYSDILINNFSTISLEAAICDLPVVHMGYDSYTFGHRFNTMAAFHQRQTHNRRELRLAASKVAKSEADLIEFTGKYLSDRILDQNARHEYAVSECGELDGRAGIRLTDMIKSRITS